MLFTHSLVVNPENERPNPVWSFENGLLSGLKLSYPSTKDECEEGVEFVTKVNDILDAL